MLTHEQKKLLFNAEALKEALKGTRVENVAVINQCLMVMDKEEVRQVLSDIVSIVYHL